MPKILHALFVLIGTVIFFSTQAFAVEGYNWYKKEQFMQSPCNDKFSLEAVGIDTTVFFPETLVEGQTFPAMVIVPGWSQDKTTNYETAARFVERGYVVFVYSPRGYGESGGWVNVAGPSDRADFYMAVDWLSKHPLVDAERIGTGWISYGALIPVSAWASSVRDHAEPPENCTYPWEDNPMKKLAAVAAIDGPASLADAFYLGDLPCTVFDEAEGCTSEPPYGQTPNKIWPAFLENGGSNASDQFDPVISQNLENLLTNTNLKETFKWAGDRSPLRYLDDIHGLMQCDAEEKCERDVALFVSNNYRDAMFRPNSMLRFFNRFQGSRKHLQMHDGEHGFAYGDAMNYRMDAFHDFFDYYLGVDVNNGVGDGPNIDLQLHQTKNKRVTYQGDQLPILSEMETEEELGVFARRTLYGHPGTGKDLLLPESFTGEERISIVNSRGAEEGDNPTTGLFIPFQEQANNLPPVDFREISRTLVLETEVLENGLGLRGVPQLSLWVQPSESKAQIFAYIYDVNEAGVGKLITHGGKTFHDFDGEDAVQTDVEMNAVNYDFPPGHRLVVAIDNFDWLYQSFGSTYRMNYEFDALKEFKLSLLVDPAVEVVPQPEEPEENNSEDETGNEQAGDNGGGSEVDNTARSVASSTVSPRDPDSGALTWVLLVMAFMGIARNAQRNVGSRR